MAEAIMNVEGAQPLVSPGTKPTPSRQASSSSSKRQTLSKINSRGTTHPWQGIRPVERQLMRPWLIDQINGGQIPGLEWTDAHNKTSFKIPWKHGSRQGWNHDTDACLFLRWAQHTGRYRAGEQPDPKRWKANFRCAINSRPDIQEVKGSSQTRGQNAFRVYRFLPEKVRSGGQVRTTKRLPKKLQVQSLGQQMDRPRPVDSPDSSSSSVSSLSTSSESPMQSPMPGSPDSGIFSSADETNGLPSPGLSDSYVLPAPAKGRQVYPHALNSPTSSLTSFNNHVLATSHFTSANSRRLIGSINDESLLESPFEWKPTNYPNLFSEGDYIELSPVHRPTSLVPISPFSLHSHDVASSNVDPCCPVTFNSLGSNFPPSSASKTPTSGSQYLQWLETDDLPQKDMIPVNTSATGHVTSNHPNLQVSLDLDVISCLETDSGLGSPARSQSFFDDNSDVDSDDSMELNIVFPELMKSLVAESTPSSPSSSTEHIPGPVTGLPAVSLGGQKHSGDCLPAFHTFRAADVSDSRLLNQDNCYMEVTESKDFLDIDVDIVVKTLNGHTGASVTMDASVNPIYRHTTNSSLMNGGEVVIQQ